MKVIFRKTRIQAIESPGLRWLFHDVPGHPVPDCPYANPRDAPAEERSVFLRPLDHPNSALKEAGRTLDFFKTKGND